MENNTYEVKKLSEFIETVSELNSKKPNQELWFRGQEDSSWRLLPAGYRNMVPYVNSRGYRISRPSISDGDKYIGPNLGKMLDEFKAKSYPYLNTVPENEFEWMFLAQHYGLPTRLLDWSLNPLVALYFAVENASFNKNEEDLDEEGKYAFNKAYPKGAAVYVINPVEINKTVHNINNVVDITQNSDLQSLYSSYTEEKDPHPICIKGNFKNERITSQLGNFTLHGTFIHPLDYYTVLQDKFIKIFIPEKFTMKIKNELNVLGINKNFVYPGLDSLAFDIKTKENNSFFSSLKQEIK